MPFPFVMYAYAGFVWVAVIANWEASDTGHANNFNGHQFTVQIFASQVHPRRQLHFAQCQCQCQTRTRTSLDPEIRTK